jgi:Sarcosine oxidase, gamma subunit family
MAELTGPLEIDGLRVEPVRAVPAAALRYLTRAGGFAAALSAAGLSLPECGRALGVQDLTLAWRSPSETLCLAATSERLAQLNARLGEHTDGCLIELTGALDVVGLSGPRVAQLLVRLGSTASLPGKGEARRSRMADVPVLALALETARVQLVLERTYSEHLLAWITATLSDLA